MSRSASSRLAQSKRRRERRGLRFESLENRHLLATIVGTGSGSLLDGDLTDPEGNGNPEANTNYNAVFRASHEADFGGGEFAFNVFDNEAGGGNSKWCCDGPGPADRPTLEGQTGTIWVDAQFALPIVLERFTITSGNDSPGRDPDQWRILGSNDGTNFTPIFTYNRPGTSPFTARDQVVRYDVGVDFQLPAPYTYIRYEAYSVVSDTIAQLDELEFFGATAASVGNGAYIGTANSNTSNALVGRDLTDPEDNGDPEANTNYNAVFSASVEPAFGGGEFAFNVFDNRVGGGNDKWCCDGPGPADEANLNSPQPNGTLPASVWVQADLPSPVVLDRFTLTNGNDTVPGRDADQFRLLGSNDGTTWTPIYTYNRPGQSAFTLSPTTAQNPNNVNKTLLYVAGIDYNQPAAFSKYRYEIYSTVSDTLSQFNELELFSNALANNDAYSVNEDATLTVPAATGVLANDIISPVYGPGTVFNVTAPTNGGTVTVNPNGSFTFNQNGAFNSLPAGQSATTSFNYSVLVPDNTSRSAVVLAPTGPNGLLHAYEYIGVAATWDIARAQAYSRNFMGKPGHLATISNLTENNFVNQLANFGDVWIGFGDNNQPSAIDGKVVPGATEGNFRWVTGEPVSFTNWGGGEPNNAGAGSGNAGEDATQMRGDGFWNDNQGGATIGQNDTTFAYVVEYDLDVSNVSQLDTAGFNVTVKQFYSPDGLGAVIGALTLSPAKNVIGGPVPLAFTDLSDDVDGCGGNFGQNIVPPGTANGIGDDNFFTNTTGTITVPAGGGTYVFTIGGDDGGRLRIDGQDVIVDDTFHGFVNRSSLPITLTAGAHTFEWVFFEGGGGACGELSYDNIATAQGRAVVGDNADGIVASNMQVTTYAKTRLDADFSRINQVLQNNLPADRIAGPTALAQTDLNDDVDGSGGDFGSNIVPPGLANGAGDDNFFVNTTGNFTVPAGGGPYVFTVGGDDGARLLIDGKVVIYDDTRHGFANFSSAPLTLAAGSHTFEWTFFEVGGGAGGELSYSNNGGTRVLLTNNAGGLTTSNVQATTWRWNPNAVPVQYFADNYAQANALATGVTPARLTVPAAAGMINMNNDPNASSCCFFPNDSGVPGVADGADNTVIEATGLVYIPAAGDWTFGFNSDDGFGMTIGGGATLGTITNGPGSNGSAGFLAYDGNRGQGTATLGVYTFPAAGFYPIRVVMWERGGGFNLELFSAPGSQTAFNAAIFDLVGDTPAGGLAVVPSLTAADASATVTITVVGQNDAPVAGTVVGKTINEDQSVTFTMVGASDPDTGAVLTYLWDIDGNGTFESTTATNSITLTPAQLAALGIDGPYNVVNPVNNVRVQVRDDQNATSAVVTTRLTVNNVAPNASIAGPGGSGDPSDPFLGGRGQASSFTFTVDDPSLIDDQARLQYSIDWGDGNVEPFTPTVGTLAADGSFSIDRQHVYNNAGDFTITLTARDKDGGVGTATAVVRIQAVFIDENGTLVIGGTGGADRIILQNSSFGIQARINNVLYPALSPLNGLVQVYGAGGNDTISVSGAVSATFEFFGGDGNDYLTGGGLNDVLHGDAGDDRLLGGGGDDLLLGGDGKDTLNGGNGNDLLYGDADGNGDATGDFADFTIEEGMSPGNDLLKGDNGDDQLHGGGGRDTLYGGVGSDELFGGDDADYLSGDAGDDLLMGEDGSDSMYGQAGNDVMIGGMLMDTLYGGAGSDLLLGDDLDVDSSLQLFAVWMQTATSDLDAARAFTSSASDDSGADNLSGQGGDDWFIAFLSDRVRDGKSSTDHLDKDGISVY